MAFVATSALPGWKLGRWTQVSRTMWQEQKLDNAKLVYQFEVVSGPSVPGSRTIRLKMQGKNTEVLLLESTIQVFTNAGYVGEYCGEWQSDAAPALAGRGKDSFGGGAVPSQPPPVQRGGASSGNAGYTPGPVAQPARQAQVASTKSSLEQTMKPAAVYAQKDVPEAAARGRQVPGISKAAPAAPFQSAQPVNAAPNLDRAPEKVQKLCDAAKNGDVNGVERLLADGIDPDGVTRDGRTPLMAAAGGGNLRVIDALLVARADPTKGVGSETPLTVAYQKGNQDILKKLFGASFNTIDSMVGSSSDLGAQISETRGISADIPESAVDNLRDVTAKIAAMNRMEVREKREISPERSRVNGGYRRVDTEGMEADVMRDEALRVRMRTLTKK